MEEVFDQCAEAVKKAADSMLTYTDKHPEIKPFANHLLDEWDKGLGSFGYTPTEREQ